MDQNPLPRGRAPQKGQTSQAKSKTFGFKNKKTKQKKQKKFVPKIKAMMKATDYEQGCITLGSVRSVEDDIIYVDLPGGVRGALILTEINSHFLERLKVAVEQRSPLLPSLEDFFEFGDFIMAVVTSSGTHPVELSIQPELVNVGLEVAENEVFYGAVKAKDDHGYRVDIGKEGVEAFLPNPVDVEIGQPLFVRITNVISDKMVRVARFQPNEFFPSLEVESVHFDKIRPYCVIDSVVQEPTRNGALKLLVGGAFNGVCSKLSWQAGLSEGDAVKARPVLIDPANKVLWMSTIESIVQGRKPLCFDEKLGSVVEADVLRIRSDVGIECGLKDETVRIFIPMKETKSDTALVAGDKHTVRLTERRPLDDLLMATDDPEILDLPVFCADDVEVGSVCDVVVEQVHPKFGVFCKMSPFLTGLCPREYCDDVLTIKKGAEVKAVVLSVDKGQVRLAIKEKLVKSELPKILSVADAQRLLETKEFTHALVRKAVKSALLVELYNEVCAMIPVQYLPLQKGQDVSKHYPVGHVIKTRVVSVDDDKINCSVVADDDTVLSLGLKLTCTVTGFTKDAVQVALPSKYGTFNAVIPNTHFADYLPLSQKIRESLRIGRKLHNCILVRFSGTNVPAVLTRKRCFRDDPEAIPKSNDDLSAGQLVFGYVSGVQSYGSFVSFYGRSSGLVHGKIFELGESLHVLVQKVENGHVQLGVPGDAGETVRFVNNFIKDCRDFAPPVAIGDEIDIQHDLDRVNDFFVYQIDETWKGITQRETEIGDKLKVAYIDALTNTIVLDEFDLAEEQIELETTVIADVIAVLDPMVVTKYQGTIIIAPMNNYNNRQDYSQFIRPGQDMSVRVLEKKAVYIGAPTYLSQNETSESVTAEIKSIEDIYATVRLPDGRTGKVHRAQLPETAKVGDSVTGQIIEKTSTIYMTLDVSSPQKFEEFTVGRPVVGIVQKVFNDFLKLSLSPFTSGTIHALHLSNSDRSIASKPLSQNFSVGDRITGWVTGTNENFVLVSAIDPSADEAVHFAKVLHIKPGDYAELSLGMNDKRRLDVIDVTDDFEFDPLHRFKEGQIIDVAFVPGSSKDVSTRQSAFEGRFEDVKLTEGQKLRGYVSHHTDSALLVRLARHVTGRLAFAKIAECRIKDPKLVFPVGSVVDVMILSHEGNKIELTSKYSDLHGKTLAFEDLKVGDQVDGFVTNSSANGIFVSLRDYYNVSGLVHRSNMPNSDANAWAAMVNSRAKVIIDAIIPEKKRINLKLVEVEEKQEPSAPSSESESSGSASEDEVGLNEIDLDLDDDQDGNETPEQLRKKLKLSEEEIAKLEAQQLNPAAPKSKEEFVALLMAAPNSSYLWVKFIEYHFNNGDIEEAKATAERALERLPIGDRDEKMNVWIALINLTVLTASESSFMEECKSVVMNAAASTDAIRIWTHFAVFTTQNKPEHMMEAWKLALKRCKGALKVWTRYLETLLQRQQFDDAQREYGRALESYKAQNSSEQWDLMQRFAVLEFRYGNTEYGRTIFDKLVQERPKHFDHWLVYVDMETKHGDEGHARDVYTRMTSLDLSPERMETTLKKWLAFEKKHGDDPKRKAHIRQIAEDYKARQMS